MLQNSFEVFLQILIPALKISQQDRKLLVEDPSEFVNISLDICEDFESKSIQTCSAQLMLAIDKSVDGMQTFMIDFVLNLQGDLPTIDTLSIQRCLAGLVNEAADISTIAALIETDEDVANPNIVKAIAPLSDEREVAFARDFVRKVRPEHKAPFWHHIGVYAYKRPVLERFVSLPVSEREADRKLEQMRALDNGMRIVVVRVDTVPLGVDTPSELETARRMLRKA